MWCSQVVRSVFVTSPNTGIERMSSCSTVYKTQQKAGLCACTYARVQVVVSEIGSFVLYFRILMRKIIYMNDVGVEKHKWLNF